MLTRFEFIFHAYSIFDVRKVGNFFEFDRVEYVYNINTLDSVHNFLDEANFFFAISCDGESE